MAESLAAIARKLNVAPSTISRALSNPELVAPKTREKILNYVQEIGYQPNLAARSLRRKRTNLVGIVVNDLSDSLIAQSASIMQDLAFERGFFPVLLATRDDPQKEKEALAQLKIINSCGLVIMPTCQSAATLNSLNIPIVELDRCSGCNCYDEFRMDDQAAMQMACSHLVSLGCQHIAVLFGNVDLVTSFRSRFQALQSCAPQAHYSHFFTQAISAHEIAASARTLTHALLRPTADNLAATQNILLPSSSNLDLSSLPPLDGIICTNHSLATGVVQGFFDHKQPLNQNIKLLTFDHPDWLQVLPQKIASLTNPLEQAAQQAMERLLDRIEGRYTSNVEARLLRPVLHPAEN